MRGPCPLCNAPVISLSTVKLPTLRPTSSTCPATVERRERYLLRCALHYLSARARVERGHFLNRHMPVRSLIRSSMCLGYFSPCNSTKATCACRLMLVRATWSIPHVNSTVPAWARAVAIPPGETGTLLPVPAREEGMRKKGLAFRNVERWSTWPWMVSDGEWWRVTDLGMLLPCLKLARIVYWYVYYRPFSRCTNGLTRYEQGNVTHPVTYTSFCFFIWFWPP